MKTLKRTYTEVAEELSKLGKPPPGRVRVYRGQTNDFGAMLPTGLRLGANERDPIWHYYAMAVGRELSPGTGTSPEDDSIWIEAIAQHYGPGSPCLDVTRSLDIALWFALHERRPVSAEHLVGPPGPPDGSRDIPLRETWWEYRPSTGPGYLYIFDVPEWNGAGPPSHGTLLDLSSRPILSISSRIKVQSACLLAADTSMSGGDLAEFYATEPIPIGWPMDGAPRIGNSMGLLFPDPSEDSWYDFFLSVPLSWVADPDSRMLNLARPFEVASYLYSSKTKVEEIRRRAKFIYPNPLYPAVEQTLSLNPSGVREFRIDEAILVLFEAPIVHWFLEYDPDMWNQAILAEDMSDEVDALVPRSETSRVPLTNVFMEFSPLDNTEWGHLTGRDGYNVQPLRALWLVRNDSHFGLYLFPQEVTAREAKNYGAGPFLYTFDPASSVFLRRDPDKTTSIEAEWQTVRDKAFWIGRSPSCGFFRRYRRVIRFHLSKASQMMELMS